jgi:serine/threonine protein kinase
LFLLFFFCLTLDAAHDTQTRRSQPFVSTNQFFMATESYASASAGGSSEINTGSPAPSTTQGEADQSDTESSCSQGEVASTDAYSVHSTTSDGSAASDVSIRDSQVDLEPGVTIQLVHASPTRPLRADAPTTTVTTTAAIGSGQYGAVYAVVGDDGNQFALKFFNLGTTMSDIQAELRSVAKFRNNSDFVQTVFGVDESLFALFRDDGTVMFGVAFELFDTTLASVIDRTNDMGKTIDDDTCTTIFQFLARVGVALNAAGIVHGDICPKNILVNRNAEGKIEKLAVCDFGWARSFTLARDDILHGGFHLTTTAPEIVLCTAAVNESDLFSIGCTMVEVLTGQPMFPRTWDRAGSSGSGKDTGSEGSRSTCRSAAGYRPQEDPQLMYFAQLQRAFGRPFPSHLLVHQTGSDAILDARGMVRCNGMAFVSDPEDRLQIVEHSLTPTGKLLLKKSTPLIHIDWKKRPSVNDVFHVSMSIADHSSVRGRPSLHEDPLRAALSHALARSIAARLTRDSDDNNPETNEAINNRPQ